MPLLLEVFLPKMELGRVFLHGFERASSELVRHRAVVNELSDVLSLLKLLLGMVIHLVQLPLK